MRILGTMKLRDQTIRRCAPPAGLHTVGRDRPVRQGVFIVRGHRLASLYRCASQAQFGKETVQGFIVLQNTQARRGLRARRNMVRMPLLQAP